MTEVRLGDKRIPFIYQGNELIHPNPVKDGLILWYDFSAMANSDVSKGIAKDLSGNGHDGELRNFNYTAESGYTGEGLKFDGTDDGITVGESDALNLSSSLTLEVALLGNDFSVLSDLIAKGTTLGSALGQNYSMSILDNILYFEVNENGARRKLEYSLTVGKRYLAQGIAGSNGMTLYVNGEKVEENTTPITQMNPSDKPLQISVNRRFLGDIHSTRIYNHPLTAEEIQHNYQLERERFNI